MLKYTAFYTRLWADKKYKSLNSALSKLIFIYLFTNEEITLTGIYELDLDVLRIRLRVNGDFECDFEKVINSEMIEWDKEEGVVWVINRFKLLPSRSPKVIIGAIDELNHLHHPFKDKFIKKYKSILNPYLYKLEGYEVNPSDLLTTEQIISLSKIYRDKPGIKRFLLNRGCQEQKIDEVLTKVFPVG